ncbi:MAG: hypothetical protein AAFZ18_28105 [Myxococcota bacterium]
MRIRRLRTVAGLAGTLTLLSCVESPPGDAGSSPPDGGNMETMDVAPPDIGAGGMEDAGGADGGASGTDATTIADTGVVDAGSPPLGELDCAPGAWTRPTGSSFSDALQSVLCHRLTCGPCSFDEGQSPPFVEREACIEHLARTNPLVQTNLTGQYDDPSLFIVNAAALDTCLGRLQSCAVPKVLEESCPELDTGRLNAGACCDGRLGCGPGFACIGRTSASTGTCQPRRGAGALCTGDAFVTGSCEVGLRCVRGFCSELVPRNGECTETFECLDGLVCSAGRCGDGETLDGACGARACGVGLFCREGRCSAWRREGESCDPATSFGSSDGGCVLGLFCRNDLEVCERLPTRGESCEDARACRNPSRDFCNISFDGREGSKRCQARHAIGEDCLGRIPEMCAVGSLCVGSVCRETLPEPRCP